MGNYLTFQIPNTEASWNYALIERSLEQSANYSELTSQVITNNTYFDANGTSSNWYRIRFFDSTNTIYSAYSAPFQADEEFYCTPREVASFMGRANFTDSTNPTRFEVEDLITNVCDEIDQESHTAWRKVRITDMIYTVRIRDGYYGNYYNYNTRISLYLKHTRIRPFVSGTTKIEVWDGTNWVDFITSYTEGRANDYWIDYERGIIYFVNRYPLWQRSNVRMTYDYGETIVPKDIKMAAIMRVASYIAGGKEDISVVYPETTLNVHPIREKWERWFERSKEIVAKRTLVLSGRNY